MIRVAAVERDGGDGIVRLTQALHGGFHAGLLDELPAGELKNLPDALLELIAGQPGAGGEGGDAQRGGEMLLDVLPGFCRGVQTRLQRGPRVQSAGLVNAFPKESVALYNYAMRGETKKASEFCKWFLPLLRMDTVPKFVQLIKLVQPEVGMGHERVRAPRCVMAGAERKEALDTLKIALKNLPKV